MQLVLDPRKLARFFAWIVISLTLVHIVGQLTVFLFGYETLAGRVILKLFHTDLERNVPSLYSSVALLFCSVLLTAIAAAKHDRLDAYAPHWAGLALIFLLLSIDEAVAIHEHLMGPVHAVIETSGVFLFAWYIPVGICLLILAAAYGRFVKNLPLATRKRFVFAGVLFVLGAIGFEMLSAWAYELHCDPCDFSVESFRYNPAYTVMATIEETLEMTGVVVFIYALARYVTDEMDGLRLDLHRRQ